jgi:prevent-host-death family protein
MRTIAAKDAKNGFGRMLDAVQREPVTIEKHGRAVAVVLSLEEYQRLEALDDAWWAARAQQAIEEGDWLGPEESAKWLNELLDAED